MNILIISKRFYTGKDLVEDRYGRIFELSAELSRLGHEIQGIALSYKRRSNQAHTFEEIPNLTWHSFNTTPYGIASYITRLHSITKTWKPDVIWASSDVPNISIAYYLSRLTGIPVAIDLYDNYESFGLTKLPPLKLALSHACRKANGITVVSHALAERTRTSYRRTGNVALIPNCARTDIFFKRDKASCRRNIGLPEDAKIIGTAGAINDSRGITDLFQAFQYLANEDPNIWLAIAGPQDRAAQRFNHPRLVNLGTVDLETVSELFNALDVGVVCNKDSDFGRYCFPLKLMELLASSTPLVAASVGDTGLYLSKRQDCLYQPGDWRQLAEKIKHHIENFDFSDLPVAPSWRESARQLSSYLQDIATPGGHHRNNLKDELTLWEKMEYRASAM